MKEGKFISLTEFVDVGFLQEANRLFFHPHGLALAMITDKETGEPVMIAGVYDFRDEPGGVVFDSIDKEKANRVQLNLYTNRRTRIKEIGSVIQAAG